jgi:hypothetical protein
MNDIEIRVKSKDESGPDFNKVEGRFKKLKQVGKAAGVGLGAAGVAAGGLFAAGLAGNMNIEVSNDKLAGQLKLTTAEAKRAGEISGKVYAGNFGGSIEEVNGAIKAVGTNMGDLAKMSSADIQQLTEGALTLAQTFEVDVNESTKAAGKLLKNGLAQDGKQAMDIITAGFQNGLDASGDFTDTLNEYSPVFKKLGFEGTDMVNILSAGLKGGARDTDAVADAFKELSIRVIDGSTLTKQGFKDLGMDAKKTSKLFAEGGEAASGATMDIIQNLIKMKDPLKQNQIGTALFGTQWEDTVRNILPELGNFEGAVGDVNGATKNLADTVGTNAQGKVDSIKRGFEQWTQKMAGSTDGMGVVTTMMLQFGPAAAASAAGIFQTAAAMKALNLAFLVSPVGLIIAGIALLVAGMVALYMKSETARTIMQRVFSEISQAVLTMVGIVLRLFKLLLSSWMAMASAFLTAAVKAFGWIPGLGDKLKGAKKAFDGFKDGVNNALDKAIKKTDEWKDNVKRMPKEVKIRGHIKDLQSKVEQAKARLKTVPKSKQAAVRADISQLQRKVRAARNELARIKNKYVTVNTHFTTTGNRTAPSEMMARGGIVGAIGSAATGGLRGSWTTVGEYGRELVKLPYGSQVIPKGRSDAMLAGAGGGGGVVQLEIISGGSRLDDLLVELLRGAIRRRGKNVQLVLGGKI